MKSHKKLACAALSLALAGALCIPVLSFAESARGSAASQEISELSAVQLAHLEMEANATGATASSSHADAAHAADTAGTCTATINYYENISYEDPEGVPNEDGRYLMGTRTITGLSEGDVLDAWDYVVDIPGFFFCDGWPGKLTVSSNPDDNEFTLIYYRQWSSEYTVNYYMMVGADLTADCWSDALAPSNVEFIKFDTEIYENQPYGMLVEGDAYEYRLDGKYVVDSYPPQIRLGSDADNNVLNVLYVPDSTHLPDDVEIPDDIFSVEGGVTGGPNDGTSNGVVGGSSSGVAGGSSSGSGSPTLPEDEVLSKDEVVGLLPEGLTQPEIDQLFKDFLGSQADAGQLEITDEMLAHPVDKKEALARIDAFNAGVEQRDAQAADQQDGQQSEQPTCDHWLCIVIIILLLIASIIGYALFARERKRNADLQEQLK